MDVGVVVLSRKQQSTADGNGVASSTAAVCESCRADMVCYWMPTSCAAVSRPVLRQTSAHWSASTAEQAVFANIFVDTRRGFRKLPPRRGLFLDADVVCGCEPSRAMVDVHLPVHVHAHASKPTARHTTRIPSPATHTHCKATRAVWQTIVLNKNRPRRKEWPSRHAVARRHDDPKPSQPLRPRHCGPWVASGSSRTSS